MAAVYVICIHIQSVTQKILEFMVLSEDILFWYFDLLTYWRPILSFTLQMETLIFKHQQTSALSPRNTNAPLWILKIFTTSVSPERWAQVSTSLVEAWKLQTISVSPETSTQVSTNLYETLRITNSFCPSRHTNTNFNNTVLNPND
jgi:uncharacterized lipoprotein YddW (UPF0748 family)